MFNVKIALIIVVCAASVFSWSSDLETDDPAVKGLAIAKEQVQRDTGWSDSTADLVMTLVNREGEKSTRVIDVSALEDSSSADRSLLVFKKPLDIKGTAFLNYAYINAPDERWIYLPAVKRVKRISSRNQSGPFMGSEFSYEDLSAFEHEEYTYKYLRDEIVNEQPCYVFEQYPKDKHSGYTKRIAWVDKTELRLQKMEFYDRKKTLLKTLDVSGYEQYLERFWRPAYSLMTNHQTGKSTELEWSNYAFRVGLVNADFKKNGLRRAR